MRNTLRNKEVCGDGRAGQTGLREGQLISG